MHVFCWRYRRREIKHSTISWPWHWVVRYYVYVIRYRLYVYDNFIFISSYILLNCHTFWFDLRLCNTLPTLLHSTDDFVPVILHKKAHLSLTNRTMFTQGQGWNCRGGWGSGWPPQFMSTDAHFWVKIGFKFQSVGKISNISTSDPQFI